MRAETARRLGTQVLAFIFLAFAAACSSGTETPRGIAGAPGDTRATVTPAPTSDMPAYMLKETGPGGGIIFYVTQNPFPCGTDLSEVCRYMEVAPFASEVLRSWSNDANSSADVPGSEGSAIGTGWANTLAIIEQGNTDPDVSAAAYAAAYEHNGYSDWYLPSRDELHELTITREVIGGFTMETYWTSTERDSGRVWYQNFLNGFQFLDGKSARYLVRPVRAF